MCQNQKCMRATRAVKMTWSRSWHDGGGNTVSWNLDTTMELFVTTGYGTKQLDPGSVSVAISFLFQKKKCSQCTKRVLRQENFWCTSKHCCFLHPVFFVTIDSIRDHRSDDFVYNLHFFT